MTALHTHPLGPRPGSVRTLRMDTHCHSRASSKPVIAAAGLIGCPESYSEPERVYDQARARGMDLVTLTDHDTIDGAQALIKTLDQLGIEYIFGYSGGAAIPIFDALETVETRMKFILVRHE